MYIHSNYTGQISLPRSLHKLGSWSTKDGVTDSGHQLLGIGPWNSGRSTQDLSFTIPCGCLSGKDRALINSRKHNPSKKAVTGSKDKHYQEPFCWSRHCAGSWVLMSALGVSTPGSHLVLILPTRGDHQAALSLQLQRTELLSELQSMNWAYSRLTQGRGEVGLQKEGFLGPPQQAAWW